MHKYKAFFRRNLKKILILLVILSFIEFVYILTFGDISQQVKDRLPVIFIGTIISEVLFLLGIGLMAYTIELEIGWNPLKWRKHLKNVLHTVPQNPLFWIGFWINATGAFLTGIIWFMAIVFGLPFGAWGVLWLPITDIILTVSLRYSILELKKEKLVG